MYATDMVPVLQSLLNEIAVVREDHAALLEVVRVAWSMAAQQGDRDRARRIVYGGEACMAGGWLMNDCISVGEGLC